MKKFNNCVAVITGAGSGIGRALSVQLAAQGARLAISDIDAASLQETAALFTPSAAEPHLQQLDVADAQAFLNYADEVVAHFGTVNLVINNAGVALSGGNLWQTPLADFRWLMEINFYGVLYGTKAFLPLLRSADWGHIVNISSLFGLISVPQQSAYNASKFAVRGMTDALRQELELDGSKVSCTSVHPGGIKTNIARYARVSADNELQDPQLREAAISNFDKLARTSAEQAAQQILNAVAKNKRRVVIGSDAKLLDKLQRLLPTGYQRILQRLMGLKQPQR